MQFYKFPKIETIEDVLPAINMYDGDDKRFIVVKKVSILS